MNQREIKRPHHLYIFGEDDLDNDDVISMVEDTPTYKRSKEVLASIKSKTPGWITRPIAWRQELMERKSR